MADLTPRGNSDPLLPGYIREYVGRPARVGKGELWPYCRHVAPRQAPADRPDAPVEEWEPMWPTVPHDEHFDNEGFVICSGFPGMVAPLPITTAVKRLTDMEVYLDSLERQLTDTRRQVVAQKALIHALTGGAE